MKEPQKLWCVRWLTAKDYRMTNWFMDKESAEAYAAGLRTWIVKPVTVHEYRVALCEEVEPAKESP